MHVVRALQRTPDCDSALGAVFSDHAVVLDIEMFLRACAVLSFHNVRRAGPDRVDIAFLQKKTLQHIVGAPHNHIPPLALFHSEDRGQRIVFNLHCVGGFPHLVFVRMSQKDNSFVAVIYFAVSETRLIGKDELNVILAGNVSSGDNGEFAPVDIAVETDGANKSARNRAANGSPMPHTLALDVVNVPSAAQQFVDPFLSGNGGANDAGFRMRAHGRESRNSSYRLRDILQRSSLDAKHRFSWQAWLMYAKARERQSQSTLETHTRRADD